MESRQTVSSWLVGYLGKQPAFLKLSKEMSLMGGKFSLISFEKKLTIPPMFKLYSSDEGL